MPSSRSAGEEFLGLRIAGGRRYLELLNSPPWSSWSEGYDCFSAGELDLPSALLLAHPMWLADPARRDRVYGRRKFDALGGTAMYDCRAEAIWGYPCKADRQSIEFDHRFPYTFGGPTEAANRLPLCRLHNSSKSSDVHLFSWELAEPRWLRPLLQRLGPWT